MVGQSMKMALKAILANKMRSFLTMLGIIIGVVALVVLVSLVNGATTSVTDEINDLGSNLLTVSVSDNKGRPMKLEDVTAWMEEEAIALTAPLNQVNATGKYGMEDDSV
jgi:putative ABC transport system permease protein